MHTDMTEQEAFSDVYAEATVKRANLVRLSADAVDRIARALGVEETSKPAGHMSLMGLNKAPVVGSVEQDEANDVVEAAMQAVSEIKPEPVAAAKPESEVHSVAIETARPETVEAKVEPTPSSAAERVSTVMAEQYAQAPTTVIRPEAADGVAQESSANDDAPNDEEMERLRMLVAGAATSGSTIQGELDRGIGI